MESKSVKSESADRLSEAALDTHPVQNTGPLQVRSLPSFVVLRAYEVYVELYGEQAAMVTGSCRGGFSIMEITAFLYARSFPRQEWRQRVDEVFAWKIK